MGVTEGNCNSTRGKALGCCSYGEKTARRHANKKSELLKTMQEEFGILSEV
jgi:hypothetical protein